MALCLVAVLEGLFLFAAPRRAGNARPSSCTPLPDRHLRAVGGVVVIVGLLSLYLVRGRLTPPRGPGRVLHARPATTRVAPPVQNPDNAQKPGGVPPAFFVCAPSRRSAASSSDAPPRAE